MRSSNALHLLSCEAPWVRCCATRVWCACRRPLLQLQSSLQLSTSAEASPSPRACSTCSSARETQWSTTTCMQCPPLCSWVAMQRAGQQVGHQHSTQLLCRLLALPLALSWRPAWPLAQVVANRHTISQTQPESVAMLWPGASACCFFCNAVDPQIWLSFRRSCRVHNGRVCCQCCLHLRRGA